MTRTDEDWRRAWGHRFTSEPPPTWWGRDDLRGISLEGLSFLAIDERTNELYWNGDRLHTERTIRFGVWELCFAGAIAVGTVGLFLIELGRLVVGG